MWNLVCADMPVITGCVIDAASDDDASDDSGGGVIGSYN
jgi:hypothetical protein